MRSVAGPFRVETFDSLGSTNDEAMARLRAGDLGGLFIAARRQTGGRGRQGRPWISPPGNLYASLALRDPAPAGSAPQLGFVAGVALAATLRTRLEEDARLCLKWPNDALFDGAKLAGILLESATLPDGGFGCAIGIGVNCRSHPDGLDYSATDLRRAGAADCEPDSLLDDLAKALGSELRTWARGAGFPEIRARWLALAAGLGRPVGVRTARGTLHGTFRDLDADGRLLLATEAGVVAIEAGDVFISSPPGTCNIDDDGARPLVAPGG